jgi:Glu-tRNA(Gln) amidotransferase subunit E-like FAD-binding protein
LALLLFHILGIYHVVTQNKLHNNNYSKKGASVHRIKKVGFARVIGVDVKTLRRWGSEKCKPSSKSMAVPETFPKLLVE